VWAATPLYAKTIDGLITCFVMALPFFRNSMVGDLIFSFLFFYCYEYAVSYIKRILFFMNHYVTRSV
jgi:hypothetical protein